MSGLRGSLRHSCSWNHFGGRLRPVPGTTFFLGFFLALWPCVSPGQDRTGPTPEAAQVPSGFRLQVIAAAPSLANPVAFAFDESGRLWVAEHSAEDSETSQGRIRLLEDPDEEGVYRTSSVIADGVPNPTSLACYNGGVFVTATPDILFIKPSQAGTNALRQIVFSGFSASNSIPAVSNGLLHSVQWALDNRFYVGTAGLFGSVPQPGSEPVRIEGTDFSFDPRSSRLEPETGVAGSGLAFDRWGNRYTCDPDRPLRRPMYEFRHALLNPFVPWPNPMEDVLNPATPVFRLLESRDARSGSDAGTAASQGGRSRTEQGWLTSVRSIAFYEGNLFPTNYRGNVFIVDPVQRVVHRAAVRETGLRATAARLNEDAKTEFVFSADASFRPVFIANGPDGALYLADAGTAPGQGRIFRIAPAAAKPLSSPALAKASIRDLVTALAHPNGWRRETAARLLYERQDMSAVPLLTNMLTGARAPIARLHALAALAGLGSLTEGLILPCLRDREERIRFHALKLLESPPPGGLSPALANQLRSLAADPSPAVRRQLAIVLARLRHPAKPALLADILARGPVDPWLSRVVLAALGEQGAIFFANAAATPRFRNDPAGHRFLLDLAAMIGTAARPEEVDPLIDFLSRTSIDRSQVFAWVQALGQGLKNAGGSLADPRARLQGLYGVALEAAVNGDLNAAVRAQAIRVLGVSPAPMAEIGDWLFALATPAEPLPVQLASIDVLCGFDDLRVPTELLSRWPQYAPAVRVQAVTALLSRVERAGPILVGLESGRPAAADFAPYQLNLLRSHPIREVAQRARQSLGPAPVRRQLVINEFQPALKLTGAPNTGRQIYNQRCASCHTAGTGQGMALTHARSRSAERLLTDILDPSRHIPREWVTSVLVSRSGEVRVGTLETSTPEAVVLREPGGGLVVYPRNHIQFHEVQEWSLMPAGLEQGLSTQSVADLISFLRQ